eukprot:353244-Chlamydomonas_euryale.AAC.9
MPLLECLSPELWRLQHMWRLGGRCSQARSLRPAAPRSTKPASRCPQGAQSLHPAARRAHEACFPLPAAHKGCVLTVSNGRDCCRRDRATSAARLPQDCWHAKHGCDCAGSVACSVRCVNIDRDSTACRSPGGRCPCVRKQPRWERKRERDVVESSLEAAVGQPTCKEGNQHAAQQQLARCAASRQQRGL